jgi:1-acyl-sn-glycerol-3-phosphate acyltransferase
MTLAIDADARTPQVTTPRQLSAAYRIAVAIARPPLMIFTRRDWRGAEHLPADGGFVACVNHISHLDPFSFAHFLYDNGIPPRFLAKESVFRIPVLGRIVSGAGQIPVYRESVDAGRAFSAAVAAVEQGECVAIYPEATLTRDPDLWPMVGKTGAARIALTTGCPVIPIAQWGAQEVLAPYGKVPHVLPRKLSQVWAGPPVDLSACAGRELDATTLRAATDTILDAITGLLEQIRGERAPAKRWDPREHGQARIGNYRRNARRGGGSAA